MTTVSTKLEEDRMPPAAVLFGMMMSYITSQAITVAAKLRIADHLCDGPRTTAELAGLTGSHEPSLYRLMRGLASAGIFRREPDGSFSNTELGDMLRTDHPESLRSAAHMICDRWQWASHQNMLHSVTTGGIAFDHTFGMPIFPYFAEHPEDAAVFDEAMTSFSITTALAVVAAYDFSGAGTIADIGGGHGLLLSKVLHSVPGAKGVLFDQPQVVAAAGAVLEKEGTAERVEKVGGDFFKEIPVAADIYLMKYIIHDWNDEQSETILRNLAAAAAPGARLLLVETVVEEDDNQPSLSKLMDLNMLVMTGGRERTAAEYAELFERTGFRLERVIPTTTPMQIVEAVRV